MKKIIYGLLSLILMITITACGMLPQVNAEERLFLNLSLDFLGEYELPKTAFQDTNVGGLSGITYDRQEDLFYAVSDDRKDPRFYTLKINLKNHENNHPQIEKINIERVTFLKNPQGEIYPPLTTDFEGIGLTPRRTVFISSEGDNQRKILPFIGEFDLVTGQLKNDLRLPQRYLSPKKNDEDQSPRGIQNNLGFESLAVGASSTLKDDPFRLFTANENPLFQDVDLEKLPKELPLRFLHYVINPIGDPIIVSENLYLLDPAPSGTFSNGLNDIVTLNQEGYFISLERNFGLAGFGVKLFQVVNANATDTSRITSFKNGIGDVEPLRKKLLLDLDELGIDLDNLEGLTFGPKLPDGSQSLILVSDDNFSDRQINQFLLFRLNIS
ncbi:MAG: esterase-like activity of phytase family protein [Snowella sp.]|nr:esterase-like activity of phytase family protein [Snowella sp.]